MEGFWAMITLTNNPVYTRVKLPFINSVSHYFKKDSQMAERAKRKTHHSSNYNFVQTNYGFKHFSYITAIKSNCL